MCSQVFLAYTTPATMGEPDLQRFSSFHMGGGEYHLLSHIVVPIHTSRCMCVYIQHR